MGKGKKSRKRGKRKHKPGKSTYKHSKYSVSGDKLERKGRICPKCGSAVFMGEHKDRYVCGNCCYMEKKSK